MFPAASAFYVGARDLDSGSHASVADSLLTEPSSEPVCFYYVVSNFS